MMPALPPKPPPMGPARTTIRRSGMPSARARRLRTSNGDCVELSISSRPSAPYSAMATRGSMATWLPGGKEHSLSTTTSAAAKAWAGSPLRIFVRLATLVPGSGRMSGMRA